MVPQAFVRDEVKKRFEQRTPHHRRVLEDWLQNAEENPPQIPDGEIITHLSAPEVLEAIVNRQVLALEFSALMLMLQAATALELSLKQRPVQTFQILPLGRVKVGGNELGPASGI